MKLDKKSYGIIYKVKDDSITPEDQWVVFLAKDNAFAEILPLYLNKCMELECDKEHIQLVKNLVYDVMEWRKANPSLLKNPDAKDEIHLP